MRPHEQPHLSRAQAAAGSGRYRTASMSLKACKPVNYHVVEACDALTLQDSKALGSRRVHSSRDSQASEVLTGFLLTYSVPSSFKLGRQKSLVSRQPGRKVLTPVKPTGMSPCLPAHAVVTTNQQAHSASRECAAGERCLLSGLRTAWRFRLRKSLS